MILKEKKSNIWPESRRRRKSIMHSEVRKKGRLGKGVMDTNLNAIWKLLIPS